MNKSVGSAIEKIKLQEQDNEAKLKEKREYEAIVCSLQRAVRETLQQIDKIDQEQRQLEERNDNLRSEVILARTQRDAIAAQMQACIEELDGLKDKSNKDILKVWVLRSSLCTAVQETVDYCDIRSLLMRPTHPELTPPPVKKGTSINDNQVSLHEARLKAAIERKEKAITERERLVAEPDMGEEFVRIKNALQYSFEMINNLNN